MYRPVGSANDHPSHIQAHQFQEDAVINQRCIPLRYRIPSSSAVQITLCHGARQMQRRQLAPVSMQNCEDLHACNPEQGSGVPPLRSWLVGPPTGQIQPQHARHTAIFISDQ